MGLEMIGIMPYGEYKNFCRSLQSLLDRAHIKDEAVMFCPACTGKQASYDTAEHYIIKANFSNHIVIHDIDKIQRAAAHLAEIRARTIVLVGCRVPEGEPGSDVDFNFGMAVGSIRHLPKGVYIALNGAVVPWREYSPN